MKPDQPDQQESDFPAKLSQPARRALLGAGYTRLEQLAGTTEAKLKQLHGMGPKALDQLRSDLALRGLHFAEDTKG
ncbi:MAG TPA: DNA-binding protein [Chloroflexia bacterium]